MAQPGISTAVESKLRRAAAVLAILAAMFAAAATHAATIEGPRVVSQTPAAAATAVEIDTIISITWDRPMAAGTTFAVAGPGGPVAGWFSYEPENRSVIFHPAGLLMPGAEYRVTVQGQRGASGAVQPSTLEWTFQTAGPTSVSIADFSAGPPIATNWWWTTWPWLMVILSALSLLGLLWVWRQRTPERS
jgi:hypothetical protein